MQKLLVIFVISVSLTSSFIVNVDDNKTTVLSEVSKPRTVDKTFNMLYNLYKMYNSSHEKKPSKKKQKLVPYDGLYYGTYNDHQPIWEDHSEEETGVMKQEEKKKEPQFWLFDNFAKKTDLLLMTKILLKIIIFKKIVKFIALVCLLFFVPTLNDSSMESTNSTSSEEHARNYDVYGKWLKR